MQPGRIQTRVIHEIVDTIRPEARVMDVRVYASWTVVRSTVTTGMASTLAWNMGNGPKPPVREAGRLLGRRVQELAELALSERPVEAAIGMAALNSGLEQAGMRLSELNAADLLMELGKGRTVAIIGAFPFARDVEQQADRTMVFDLRPGFGQYGPGDYPLLQQAEVVAVTGTVFLTHTLDQVLAHINRSAYTLMVGPTTPMSPALFELGFDALCGVQVESFEQVNLAVSQGASLKQVTGLRFVTGVKTVDRGRGR